MDITIEDLLSQDPDYHVWILEYVISHGRRMNIALHRGVYGRRSEVEARRCTYFRGSLEGGPYRLALERRDGSVRLFDEGGALELICDELVVGRVWAAVEPNH